MPFADRPAQRSPGGMDGVGIDIAADLARDIGLTRWSERQRNEHGLKLPVRKYCSVCHRQIVVLARRCSSADRSDVVHKERHRERLDRLPSVERIGIVRSKEAKIGGVDRY
jgi:hypothetical protein